MTVFEVMSRLAIEHGSINLGQGFPDEEGPETIVAKLDEASRTAPNQYPPMMGVPELRQAIAAHAKRFYDLGVDWQTEVMVTSGATEALAASILSLLNPGDEAVVFEPLYDSYVPMLRRAGAEVKLVPLKPPDWAVPPDHSETLQVDGSQIQLDHAVLALLAWGGRYVTSGAIAGPVAGGGGHNPRQARSGAQA